VLRAQAAGAEKGDSLLTMRAIAGDGIGPCAKFLPPAAAWAYLRLSFP